MSAPRRLRDGERTTGHLGLSAYVRTYVPRPRVVIKLDGRMVLDEKGATAHRVGVDVGPGRHAIVLAIYDGEGRLAGKQTVSVVR